MAVGELRTFELPDRDEMLQRLLRVESEQHLVQNFYPLLLKHAGVRKAGAGVVMMFVLAISDYTVGMPPAIAAILHMRLSEFVTALIDDEQVRADALAMLEAAEAR